MFKAVGSPWLAVVILMLLLVAMGSATAYESTYGTERARAVFYDAWWFELLLALLGLNMLAAMVDHFPFTRRQIGFVVTHVSILLILVGALITKQWGIDGQVSIEEGQTVSAFRVSQESLTVVRGNSRSVASLDLDSGLARSGRPVDLPPASTLSLDGLQVTAERYLPDSDEHDKVVDDDPRERVAVEVAIGMGSRKPMKKDDPQPEEMRQWVFAEDPARKKGTTAFKLQVVDSLQELTARLAQMPASQPSSKGTVNVEYQGKTHSFPVEQCTSQPAPVGDTGYTVRVLRYLPHAVVGQDHQISSASSQPVNPAIEAEITGPKGTNKRFAFARFPDFQTMHGADQQEVKLSFTAADSAAPSVPVEIYASRSGELGVRFTPEVGAPVTKMLAQGQAVETPWPGVTFTLRERYNHARLDHDLVSVEPPRESAIPALRVSVKSSQGIEQFWLRKGSSRTLTAAETAYRITFDDRVRPLGFDLTLDRFRIGYYPGTQRPRSFESQITLSDPSMGRQQSHVVSMNRPVSHGDYTLYQSSYHQQPGRKTTSILSVSWDPGKPVVFAGYILMFLGMVWMLAMRRIERRQPGDGGESLQKQEGSTGS